MIRLAGNSDRTRGWRRTLPHSVGAVERANDGFPCRAVLGNLVFEAQNDGNSTLPKTFDWSDSDAAAVGSIGDTANSDYYIDHEGDRKFLGGAIERLIL